MILHELRVSGFRSLAGEVTIGPFAERITVLHAPNGTGKTTLIDAFAHAMLESHTLHGKGAEATMRSAGRQLAPSVTVTFSSGRTRYRLEKRFLDGGSARLARDEGGVFVPWLENDAATLFARQLLSARSPDRGPMNRRKHYGLGAILWSAQGDSELALVSNELSGLARERIGGGAAAAGVADAGALASAKEWYERFYAPKGALARAAQTVDLPGKRAAVELAREACRRAAAAVEEIDRLRLVVDETADARSRFERRSLDLGAECATQEASVATYTAATSAAQRTRSVLEAATERHATLRRSIDAIARARIAVDEAARLSDAAGERRRRAGVAVATSRAALEKARVASDVAALEVEAAEAGERLASDAVEFTHVRDALATARRRLTAADALVAERDEAIARRAVTLAPDAPTMRAIRTAIRLVETIRIKLDAAVLHVEFEAESAQTLELGSGASSSNLAASPGVPFHASGSPTVVLRVAGVGTFRARGPAASAEALRLELERAEAGLAALAAPFETADLATLEALATSAGVHDAAIAELDRGIVGTLDGASSPSILKTEIATLQRRLELSIERYPAWHDVAPDAVKLAGAARARIEAARDARREAAATDRIAFEQLALDEATSTEAAHQAAEARARLAEAEGGRKTSEADGLTDAARTRAVEEAGLALLDARRANDASALALAPFGEDPQPLLETLRRRRDGAVEMRGSASEEHAAAKALLEHASASGAYDTFALAEAASQDLERKLSSLEAEARAAQLLYTTFAEVTAEREAAVLEPVRHRTAALYARVAGRALDVRLNADFTLGGVDSGGMRLLQTLSGGETEQLHMISRLALADLITDGERQLVILDDTLGVTDPQRFARFLGIVDEFARDRMQFVIATCDASRYHGLDGASYIDLAKHLRNAALPPLGPTAGR